MDIDFDGSKKNLLAFLFAKIKEIFKCLFFLCLIMIDSTSAVYNRIAIEYDKHHTSNYLSTVQYDPIFLIFDMLAKPDKPNKRVLIVGIGNSRAHLRQISWWIDPYAVKPWLIDLFDTSPIMLEVATLRAAISKRNIHGFRILGDANHLGEYFKENSYDFVLAPLCDHIENQDSFFEGAYKILNENGVLMTTYPGKELQHAIRRHIYHIDVNKTRFIIDGKNYEVPSKLYSSEELAEFYKRKGFVDVEIYSISSGPDIDKYCVTPTILKGCKIIGKTTRRATIVTMGTGRKKSKGTISSVDKSNLDDTEINEYLQLNRRITRFKK